MAPITKRSWCTAKERLNVAARTSPVRMVGAHSGIAHTREGVRVDTMPGRVESWHLAISPRRQYYVLVERCRRDQTHCSSRLCMCQVRAMNEHNVSWLRTQLQAVRARTREAQAACTSRYPGRRLGEVVRAPRKAKVAWSAAHACAQRVDDFWQLFRARAARGAHTQARLGGAACSSPRSIKRTSWRERLGEVRACAGQGSGALIGRPKYRGTLRLLHVSSGRSCWRPQRWRPQRYAGAWRQASRPRSTVADHCTGAVYF